MWIARIKDISSGSTCSAAEDGCSTTGPFITRVNRQEQWLGSDLPPNKKCIPRLLTPIMGGKNLPVCPSLAPVTLAPFRQEVDSLGVEGWRWWGTLVTASPHPIFHR